MVADELLQVMTVTGIVSYCDFFFYKNITCNSQCHL